MTSREKRMYENVINSEFHELTDMYESYPWDYELRQRIYLSLRDKYHGHCFAVIDVPGHSFSAGFIYELCGSIFCRYFTETNNFDFLVK